MDENYIIVSDVKEADIESILMDLANLYTETAFVNGIQLYRKKGQLDSFLILFSNQPDFERFCYFVNYIKYPEGYKNFTPFIRGYYQTTSMEKSDFGIGEWIVIYVPKSDISYDNVNLVKSDNSIYQYDFGGKVKKVESTEIEYEARTINLENYHHLIDIFPSSIAETFEVKPWWKFW